MPLKIKRELFFAIKEPFASLESNFLFAIIKFLNCLFSSSPASELQYPGMEVTKIK
ncbi:MAG: hypothetical protein CFH10_00892 [Alphaproteobacteria bacterium MarineAlpha4_Bin2]|nr:MAG: hypothetical protein CFH10_00892 [Alphaproteobacteria bacterium MarineAlpha4_Bin2]